MFINTYTHFNIASIIGLYYKTNTQKKKKKQKKKTGGSYPRTKP